MNFVPYSVFPPKRIASLRPSQDLCGNYDAPSLECSPAFPAYPVIRGCLTGVLHSDQQGIPLHGGALYERQERTYPPGGYLRGLCALQEGHEVILIDEGKPLDGLQAGLAISFRLDLVDGINDGRFNPANSDGLTQVRVGCDVLQVVDKPFGIDQREGHSFKLSPLGEDVTPPFDARWRVDPCVET